MPPKKNPDQKFNPADRDPSKAALDEIIKERFTGGDKKATDHEESIRAAKEHLERVRQDEQNPDSPTPDDEEPIGNREERGNWRTNVEPAPKQQDKKPLKQRLKSKRNVLALTLVIGGFMGGFGLLTIIPAYFLVQFKETAVNKFGDRLDSLGQPRVTRIATKQIAASPFTAGCKAAAVKCRYKGMTKSQIKKFERRNAANGITVKITAESRFGFRKQRVKSINFTDEKGNHRVAPKDFGYYAKNNATFQHMVVNYNKSKVAALKDKAAGKMFVGWKIFLGKVRAPRGPPQTEEEILKQRADRKKSWEARRQAITDKHRGTIRKADIISTLCAIKGLIKAANVAVKVVLAADEIKMAMDIARPADMIKLGEATGDRETQNAIANVAQRLNTTDANGETAADSPAFQYASYGTPPPKKSSMNDYQMGLGSEKGFFAKIANASGGVPGLTAAIDKILNPAVCTVAGGLSLIACVLSGLTYCIASAATVNLLVTVALPLIIKDLIKTPPVGDEAVGGQAGTGGVGGFSAMLSKSNPQYHGGFPLTKEQAEKYDGFSNNAQGEGNWTNASALDIYDPKSFSGKLANAFLPSAMRLSASASNIPTTLTSLPQLALSRMVAPAQAATKIAHEYDRCEDAEYKALNLATDPLCVPQYGLDPSMVLGDNSYNDVAVAPRSDDEPGGFDIASLFTTPTAEAKPTDLRGFIPDNRFDADKVLAYMCGHDLDNDEPCDRWIDENGAPLATDEEDDDFADYTEQCLETNEPLSADSPDMCKPKKCKSASSVSDEFRYCMYSQYAFDTTIDDQLEDRDANAKSTGNADEAVDTADTADPSGQAAGDTKALAQALLDNPNVTYPYTDTTGMKVDEVLREVAKTGKGIVNSPDASFTRIPVSPKLLQALVDYAKDHKIGLNALTNADHSSTSNHYKGIAIDLACEPALDRAAFETIAAKYGGRNNGEICPGFRHWHYDFPKQDDG